MPATRAQRQRVQQRRHANLPDELIRKIIETAGPYCVLVKGGQACTLEIPRTAGRTAKSYLAPVSNNLIRVPEDYDLAGAVAAARDGHTILVEDNWWDVDEVIAVPPIRLQIVGVNEATYGTKRTPRGEFSHDPDEDTPVISGSFNPRDGGGDEEDGGVFWVEGTGAQLTLRNIAFMGVSDDWQDVDDDQEIELGGHDTAICALRGARVCVENCWFSQFGRMGLRASSGARIEATDCTFNRSFFGTVSEGPGSSVVLQNVDFQGDNVYACMTDEGGRTDLKACRIRGAQQSGVVVKDAGSRIRFDASTQFVARRKRMSAALAGHPPNEPLPWAPRGTVVENGSLTFPDTIPGAIPEGAWGWLTEVMQDDEEYTSDVEWESDDDHDDETRWLTVTHAGWETGHERCMSQGQEGWLPPPPPRA